MCSKNGGRSFMVTLVKILVAIIKILIIDLKIETDPALKEFLHGIYEEYFTPKGDGTDE